MKRHAFNPNQLLTFLRVLQYRSESRAAVDLSIGQPAVSMQLKGLEADLGVKLFDRTGRKLILTSAGKVAERYAFQLSELCNDLEKDLQTSEAERHQMLRLGILDGIPKPLVVSLSSHLLGNSNAVSLELSEGKGSYLMSELSHHQLDAVILNHSPDTQALEGLRAKKLGSLEVGVFGSGNMQVSKGSDVDELLRNAPLILPTYHSRLRGECDRYFIERNIKPVTRVEVEDTALQMLLVQSGFGIAMLPVVPGSVTNISGDPQVQQIGTVPGIHEDIWLVSHPPGKGKSTDELIWQAAAKIFG
jgi:LysR family transcriptional activator of nhaA